MPPRLEVSFHRGGVQGIALLGPSGSKPDLPIDGLQLFSGIQVHLYEKDKETDGTLAFHHVDGIVAGWNDQYQCWYATYDFDALEWTPELEGVSNEVSFDEWVRRVFDHAIETHWWFKEETGWNKLSPSTSLDYLTQLFEQSSQLLQTYSDAQVDQGLWLLIGPGGDIADSLSNLSIAWPTRLRCVRSILRLFEMFAARCSPHLSHLDESGANPLNSICYMFWDILPISGSPNDPALADLNRSLLDVMIESLRLPSDACREAALHGLGHWQINYPNEVELIIATFLAENPNIRPELRQYAERARNGNVQ